MLNKPYIVLNSIPRCGNTFLAYSFEEALNRNIDGGTQAFYKDANVLTHAHQPLLLKIPKEDTNVIQFTIFRDPIQQIPSLFGLGRYRQSIILPQKLDRQKLNQDILSAIKEYATWTSLYLENKNSNLILFEDLKNNINNVLEYMFNILGLDFKNTVDEEVIKNNMKSHDLQNMKNEELFFMGRLPRGFESTPEYIEIQTILKENRWINYNFKQLVKQYSEILELKQL